MNVTIIKDSSIPHCGDGCCHVSGLRINVDDKKEHIFDLGKDQIEEITKLIKFLLGKETQIEVSKKQLK